MDLEVTRKNLLARIERKRSRKLERFQKAAADFERIIDMIVKKYSPQQIIQWGSLLNQDKFDDHSDIDIAVKGIVDAPRFFALLGDAMKLTRFPLDIVQLEKIEPKFAEIIMMKGKVIYDA